MSYFLFPIPQAILTWVQLSHDLNQQAYFKSQQAIALNNCFAQFENKKQETFPTSNMIGSNTSLTFNQTFSQLQKEKLKKQKTIIAPLKFYKASRKEDTKISQISLNIGVENRDCIFQPKEKMIQQQCHYMTKQIKLNKNKNKKNKQDQYKPFQKKKRTTCSKYKENQNRNIIPNEINQILSYIQKPLKSQFILQRIFKKYPQNQNYTIKKFYQYQNLLKDKTSNYASQYSLSLVTQLYEPKCEIYTESEQRYYIKICRVLIRHFLQQDSIFNILTSKRMKSDKKRDHIKMRREIYGRVMQVLRE